MKNVVLAIALAALGGFFLLMSSMAQPVTSVGKPIIACIGMSSAHTICEGENSNWNTDGLGFLDRFTGSESVEGFNLALGGYDITKWSADQADSSRTGGRKVWTEWVPWKLSSAGRSASEVTHVIMWMGVRYDTLTVDQIIAHYQTNFAYARQVFPNLQAIYLTTSYKKLDSTVIDSQNNITAVYQLWGMGLDRVFAGPDLYPLVPHGFWVVSDGVHPGNDLITDGGALFYQFVPQGTPPTATPTPTPAPTPTLVSCERVATYSNGSKVTTTLPLGDC